MTKTPAILAALALAVTMTATAAPSHAQSATTIWVNASEAVDAGRYALKRGKIDQAIKFLERGLKTTTSNRTRVAALNDLCVAYRLKGDAEAAIRACDAALEINPSNWRVFNNRGNVHYDSQNYLVALGDYEAALKLKPKSKIVRKNIDMVRSLTTSAE